MAASTVGDSLTERSCHIVSEHPLACKTYCIMFNPITLISGVKIFPLTPLPLNVPPLGVAVKVNGLSSEQAERKEPEAHDIKKTITLDDLTNPDQE